MLQYGVPPRKEDSIVPVRQFQCSDLLAKRLSKVPAIMHLLHCLWFLTTRYDIDLVCEHIPGSCNTTADNLSRNIDMCLPFGLRSTPKLFNVAADLLQWGMQQLGVTKIMQYLDGFLMLRHPTSEKFQNNLVIIKCYCNCLGVPLAVEKVEGPSTILTFLGITNNTFKMEISLPDPKLYRICKIG